MEIKKDVELRKMIAEEYKKVNRGRGQISSYKIQGTDKIQMPMSKIKVSSQLFLTEKLILVNMMGCFVQHTIRPRRKDVERKMKVIQELQEWIFKTRDEVEEELRNWIRNGALDLDEVRTVRAASYVVVVVVMNRLSRGCGRILRNSLEATVDLDKARECIGLNFLEAHGFKKLLEEKANELLSGKSFDVEDSPAMKG